MRKEIFKFFEDQLIAGIFKIAASDIRCTSGMACSECRYYTSLRQALRQDEKFCSDQQDVFLAHLKSNHLHPEWFV